MYHPTRGGVRGGRDQFKWDDVKVDKHRENYLGHSIKAPVGRWQKGKDLFWYAKDKNQGLDQDDLKAEIQKVKEEEEQLMREALGLAPKRSGRPQGNRLDKHEFSELVKRGSTAEDVGGGHAEAAQVQGVGFSRGARGVEASTFVQPSAGDVSAKPTEVAGAGSAPKRLHKEEDSDDEGRQKKRRHEDRKREKREERKRDKHEAKERRHSDEKKSRRKDKDRKRDRD